MLFPQRGEEKVRKFRSLITADHMRVSWGKGNENPYFRFLRWTNSKKLSIYYCTYIPNNSGDCEKHFQICSKNRLKPWNYRWWFGYDPSFGIEAGSKSSELYSTPGMNAAQTNSFSKDSKPLQDSTLSSFSGDGTKPALCYIMYAHSMVKFKKTKNILLNFPGGGFVSMSPPCHDDYLSQWATQSDSIIVSVDYAKSPEYPYPYAIDQCFEVYKALVNTNGKCIGLDLDEGEKVSIVIVGDSAGANITASTMFKIIESEELLPIPKGLVFIYGIFNFDIRAWMTKSEMDMINGVTITANHNSSSSEKNPANLILDPKDHLQYISPLAFNKISNAFQSTALSWIKKNLSIADDILLVKTDQRKVSQVQTSNKDNLIRDSSSVGIKDEFNNPKLLRSNTVNLNSNFNGIPQDSDSFSDDSSYSEETDSSSENPHYFLSMTSRFTYFSDMILTPEMMRAIAILYIGPNKTPNFEKDYYLSPIVAPEELLAKFPNTYFMCGEKDPLVDDTVILAGRIRDAKAKLKAKNVKKQFASSFANLEKIGGDTETNLKNSFTDSSEEDSSSIPTNRPKPKKISSRIHSRKGSKDCDKEDQINHNPSNTYKPYRRQSRFEEEKSVLDIDLKDSLQVSSGGFYIGDSSGPNSTETSDVEDSDSQISDSGYSGRKNILKSLWMTKFSSRTEMAGVNNKEKSSGSQTSPLLFSGILGKSNEAPENEDEGVWDLTSTERESVRKVYSQAQLNSILNRSNSSLSSLNSQPKDDQLFNEYIGPEKARQEIEYLDSLSSTIIKVKILEGMSHGFMQMGSVFPESQAAINTIGGWIDELFCVDDCNITNLPRTQSVISNSALNKTKVKFSLEEINSAPKVLPLKNLTNIDQKKGSNANEKVRSYLDQGKNYGLNGDETQILKEGIYTVNSDKIVKDSVMIPSYLEAADPRPVSKVEPEIENIHLDIAPLSEDLNSSNSMNSSINDVKNLETANNKAPVLDGSLNKNTKETLNTLPKSNNGGSNSRSKKRISKLIRSSEIDSNSKSASNGSSDDALRKSASHTPKGDVNLSSSVDRHGNVVVSSSEMVRRRGNHLLENLGKGA
ncbi:Hormone-sensitive lipase [Smittium mucronatum]|uniref:Hormone-sensitive lipase n=1 Tax=Smittium mucronatum TaxID=133383 RepID=A0A1R0GW95_9FUNG|nr:Hormone-sensitive lipase [Smittium mucronatum]